MSRNPGIGQSFRVQSDYHRTVRWLESLVDLPIYDHRDYPAVKGEPFVLGLRRMVDFLDALEIPRQDTRDLEITHVAGTSGKGSVCAFLAAILHEEEKTKEAPTGVGAFFSPHVTTLTERAWANGKLIPPADLVRIVEDIKPVLREMFLGGRYGIPSYFEITMALALLHFRARECGRVILEVGLGGAYDATNVFPKTALSIITTVGLDHTDILGNTAERIAAEKAGIVKPGGLVLSGVQEISARRVIERICREKNARLIALSDAARLRTVLPEGCVFDFQPGPDSGLTPMEELETRMPGRHQAHNASLAAAAAQVLGVHEPAIRRGLKKARLPARVEVVGLSPAVVLDGAHNPDKARALLDTLDLIPASRRFFVLGVLGDKDVSSLCQVLLPKSAGVFVTRPAHPPRPAFSPKALAEAASRFAPVKAVFLDPFDAVEAALDEAGENDLVCVAGSLFLAGEVRDRWYPLASVLAEETSFPHARVGSGGS
ncbi:MAG: bifunctional folylpolyglutamate synthase/dihydrofolate synthase [Nitrospinota bacterium]